MEQIKRGDDEEGAETPNGDEEAQNGEDDEANDGDETPVHNEERAEDEGNQEAEGDETNDAEEKASSDDDVVTGNVAEAEGDEAGNENEESPKIEEIVKHEERNDPSTGDSGVDDPAQDEEQVLP